MAPISSKKIIMVTGANGMLGSTFCALLEKKNVVLALHRDDVCYARCTEGFSVELSNKRQVTKILRRIEPDVVVHCAGLVDVDRCEQNPDLAYESNVEATENVLAVCGGKTKFVYISSDQVYGDCDNHAETCGDPNPVNIYGNTKLRAEQMILAQRPDSIVARTNIFGWNVKPGKVSSAEKIVQAIESKDDIALFYDYLFSPIYAGNLGLVIVALSAMRFSGIINIGSSAPCSKYEFGKEMARLMGYRSKVISRESLVTHSFLARRPGNLTLPTTKCEAMGITLPDYSESLRQFLGARQPIGRGA